MVWEDLNTTQPHKGQIVEILVWKPAVYKGVNDFGCHEWDTVDYLENVIYWKTPDSREVYSIVLKHMKGQEK